MKRPFDIIDLTHTLVNTSPSWEGGCGFEHETVLDYTSCTTDVKFMVQKINMYAGLGTHVDAPAHCIPGGKTSDALTLDELIAPCIVIDVSTLAHESYRLPPEAILSFEQKNGRINPGSFVIINTGWSKYWSEPAKYRNNLQFPAISPDAALLLLERKIVGLGIDTLSPDTPDSGYPVHQTILSAGKYIVENVANANKLPTQGSFSFTLPIQIAGCTEAPVRLIGLVNHGNHQS